jgi:thiamine-phosphate diphosphorylase
MATTLPRPDLLKSGLFPLLDLHRSASLSTARIIEAFLDADCDLFIVRQKDGGAVAFAQAVAEITELSRLMSFRFIVHHAIAVAAEHRAAGVHLTAQSVGIAQAREILGPAALIGYSAHSLEEALVAEKAGCDYIFLGAIYATPKPTPGHPLLGTEELARVCHALTIPVYAIGGINETNLKQILAAGAAGFSCLRALYEDDNIEHNAAKLGFLWEDATIP